MVDVQLSSTRLGTESMALSYEVEQFLYREADLLDCWRLPEWLDLFAPSGQYLVPATDKPDGDPDRHLFLVHDDRFLLQQRVDSLMRRSAHAEYPHSRTRRMISNVRAEEDVEGRVDLAANFVVYRVRFGTMDTYVGGYRHLLERDENDALRFLTRRAELDLDALRPQGKVSIIL